MVFNGVMYYFNRLLINLFKYWKDIASLLKKSIVILKFNHLVTINGHLIKIWINQSKKGHFANCNAKWKYLFPPFSNFWTWLGLLNNMGIYAFRQDLERKNFVIFDWKLRITFLPLINSKTYVDMLHIKINELPTFLSFQYFRYLLLIAPNRPQKNLKFEIKICCFGNLSVLKLF